MRCSRQWHPGRSGQVLTRLFQPSVETLLGLRVRRHTTLGDRLFSARDALEHGHALLHELEALNVHEVGARQAVLRDENRLLVPLNIGEELGRLALEGGNEFCTHRVTLQYHSGPAQVLGRKGLTPELSRAAKRCRLE